jgi:acyl carrier protein
LDAKERIRSFILETVLAGSRTSDIADDDSFMDKGIIDSTGILELVAFIQDEWKFEVRDEELVPDNFDSIAKLSGYISRKTGG